MEMFRCAEAPPNVIGYADDAAELGMITEGVLMRVPGVTDDGVTTGKPPQPTAEASERIREPKAQMRYIFFDGA